MTSKCEICAKIFATKYMLKRHLEKAHPKKPSDTNQKSEQKAPDKQTYERQNSSESISSLDIIENTMYEMGYTPEGIPLPPLSWQQRQEILAGNTMFVKYPWGDHFCPLQQRQEFPVLGAFFLWNLTMIFISIHYHTHTLDIHFNRFWGISALRSDFKKNRHFSPLTNLQQPNFSSFGKLVMLLNTCSLSTEKFRKPD